MSTQQTPREILLAASDLLEEHGWCQGTLYRPNRDGDHSYCLLGAVGVAAGLKPGNPNHWYTGQPGPHHEAIQALRKHLRATYSWNDKIGRKKEEVITALRAAAREIGYNPTKTP